MIYEKLVQILGEDKVEKDVLLKEHTTFKVGGPCDCMVFPASVEDVAETIKCCKNEGSRYYVLGNGSNVIAPDEGYHGVIIKLGKYFANIREDNGELVCQAGALVSAVAKKAFELGLTGMEFAEGIPGSVGGGTMMNCGAYDGELKNVVKSVTALTNSGEVVEYTADKCCFGYRDSIFHREGLIVLETRFVLVSGNPDEIEEKMLDFRRRRTEKQPLHLPSAGSTFKRPEGNFAGKLIQDSGLKGVSIGGAQVSELHAGFIINKGDATAEDILSLIKLVQNTVYDKYKVELHTEVRVIE